MEDCSLLGNASDTAESVSNTSSIDSLSADIIQVNKLIIIGL